MKQSCDTILRMKRLKLIRVSGSAHVTLGVLIDQDDGLPFLVTLEKPWLFNQKDMSCIPTGVYYFDKRNDKDTIVYESSYISGRTDIQFEVGNTAYESKGCIFPGKSYGKIGDQPAVLSSKDALDILYERVGESFSLVVE